MRPQVHLIDPGTNSNLNLLPLGVGRIASYCRSLPAIAEAFEVEVHFLRMRPEALAEKLERPVVVGLAAYVWNLRASLAYAEAIRRRHPDCVIALGGASIPKRPERAAEFLAANPMIDVLVQGEGEDTFADLVLAVAEGRDLAKVPGIAFRRGDGAVTNPARPRMVDLDVIPSPFLDGSFDRLFALHGERVTGAVLESNRGCPYSCTFCDWGGADVRKVRMFDAGRMKAEFDWVAERGIPYIFLADANFGIFSERDLDLADHLAECRRRTGNPRFMGINWTKSADNQIWLIAERLSAAGIQAGVTLAAQSFHPATLDAIKRRNLSDDRMEALRQRCHQRGVVTYNDLILGLPEETLATFVAGLDHVMTYHSGDHWVVHLCNILENTEMAEPDYMTRYAIETRSCMVTMTLRIHDPDEVEEQELIVVGTSTMPRADWQRAYDIAYLSAALHNFRVAFFPMNLLKARFGSKHTDFVAFVLDLARNDAARLPLLARGAAHLERQRDAILAGIARYSPVAELGDFNASPQEALLAVFLDDPDTFYGELDQAIRRFCQANGFDLSDDLLADLLLYQRQRMNIWQPEGIVRHSLGHALPAYFAELEAGNLTAEPVAARGEIELNVPRAGAADRFDHARQRTRGARYTDMLAVAWLDG